MTKEQEELKTDIAIESECKKLVSELTDKHGKLSPVYIQGLRDGIYTALTTESIYSKADLVKQKDFPLQKLIDIRNALYDRLPRGEVNSWELLDVVKWHINNIDTLCSEIQPLPTPPKQ